MGVALSGDDGFAVGVEEGSEAGTVAGSYEKVVDTCLLVNDDDSVCHEVFPLRLLEFESLVHNLNLFSGKVT